MDKQEKQKRETMTSILLCCLFFIPAINNFLNCILQTGLEIPFRMLTPATYIALIIIGAFSFLRLRKKGLACWLSLLTFAVLLLVSFLSYPEIRGVMFTSWYDPVYNPMYKILFFYIPALIYATEIGNYKNLYSVLIWFARITLIIGVFAYAFVVLYKNGTMQYMVFSYFLITAVCACFENVIQKHNVLDLLLAIAGSASMILCGARGAIVSLVAFLVLRFFVFYPTKNRKTKVILLSILIAIIVAFFLFGKPLLVFVAGILEHFGVDSRFISTLADGSFFDGSGRDELLNIVMRAWHDNPIGYGLYGDRYVTGVYGWGSNTYAHNLVLELLCDFGLFGIFILAVGAFFFLRAMIGNRDKMFVALIWIMLPYGLFQLFFSSSFLENMMFYAIVGFVIRNQRNRCLTVDEGGKCD